MKRETVKGILVRALALCALAAGLCLPAFAQADAAGAAQSWLARFAQALSAMQPLNDPAQTADPARAGEYLLEYAFGTVTTSASGDITPQSILSADIRTQEVTDWRGLRVGMSLADALGGARVEESSTQLYVLDTDESGPGWSWAYVGDGGVYGVEHIVYGGEGADMTEYTLTYVIERGVISAIRVKRAPATQAQAQDGLGTAREIASRQHGEILALANDQSMFTEADVQIMGGQALGAEVADLIVRMGEPEQVQTLPDGGGRILLYDGAAVTLGLDEYTGVEIVRGVSVSDERIDGPRRLTVGMSVQEAAALFRCDQDVSSLGGALYLEGEAMGEAPCGELAASGAGDVTLSYACLTDKNEIAVLEAGVQEGMVTYWHLIYQSDMEGGM